MTDLRVAVDYDGTLTRSMDFVCEHVNLRCGTKYDASHIDSWDFFRDRGHGDAMWAAFNELDADVWARTKNLAARDPWALPILDALSGTPGVLVDVVTCNEPRAEEGIKMWLRHRGVHHVSVKCVGRKSPAEKLHLDYDVYVDDHPGLMTELIGHEAKRGLIAVAPWNRKVPGAYPWTQRFHSWAEVPALLNSIMEERT